MPNFDDLLNKYAVLTLSVGIHIQPGQPLLIEAPIEANAFVRRVVENAYKMGAQNVQVFWEDEEVTRTTRALAPEESLREYPTWRAKWYEDIAERGGALLAIRSENPDLFQGIDPNRIALANKARTSGLERFLNMTRSDQISWCVVSIPTSAWAARVFPDVPEEQQIPALWDAIFTATRVDQPDPVAAWHKHLERLLVHENLLNQTHFKKLHFTAPGTDLVVELPENHLWVSGGKPNAKQVMFVPNIPTEEVFTAPRKDGVNGYVRSTMPLNHLGSLIENLYLKFENGRIVDFGADSGLEALKQLIETDEGSHFLGEVALVPVDSPITKQNRLFYNTLYDENASCHLAIGSAYPTCLKGGGSMTNDEISAQGINYSLTHVDFMIGSEQLNVDGETYTGEIVPVLRNGNWSF